MSRNVVMFKRPTREQELEILLKAAYEKAAQADKEIRAIYAEQDQIEEMRERLSRV